MPKHRTVDHKGESRQPKRVRNMRALVTAMLAPRPASVINGNAMRRAFAEAATK